MKKQTVWLLTMLSLMVVLSVYYLMMDKFDQSAYSDQTTTSAEHTNENNENEQNDENDQDMDAESDDAEVEYIHQTSPDELFTMIRMELQNKRSMKKDQLKDIIASSTATTSEKNEALNNIYSIDEIATKEVILQNTILATSDNYEDVLVRHDDDQVHVYLQTTAGEMTKTEVNHIMQMVRDEFGELNVIVKY